MTEIIMVTIYNILHWNKMKNKEDLYMYIRIVSKYNPKWKIIVTGQKRIKKEFRETI